MTGFIHAFVSLIPEEDFIHFFKESSPLRSFGKSFLDFTLLVRGSYYSIGVHFDCLSYLGDWFPC
jgi:hypothetical protein